MKRIIGIDHGYGYIKTVHHEFRTGVQEFHTEPPIMQRVVKYNGTYYSVGGSRQNVRLVKWQDENYWVMTLAAVAEELGNDTDCDVILAVGLPLTRFGAEKAEFKKYLMRGIVDFEYQSRPYKINIVDVMVFPQGYSAVADKLNAYRGLTVICDMGSWTVDILPLENGTPNMNRITTLDNGVIKAMNTINEELRREFGGGVDEIMIQDLMMGGYVQLPYKYRNRIIEGLNGYAGDILSKLKELGFNTETTPFIFTGGGAVIIKLYGDYDKDMTEFMEDIHANAKGYERIATQLNGGI